MALLNELAFDNRPNAYSDEWFLFSGSESQPMVETLGGDDMLLAKTPAGTSYAQTFFILNGLISTGNGNDKIIGDGGSGFQSNEILLFSFSGSQSSGIDTGNGNDTIIGIGSGGGAGGFGIANFSSGIRTGNGDDVIIGRSAATGLGIYNYGIIDTGCGDDRIIASGMINGGQIFAGKGDDVVEIEDAAGDGGQVDFGDGNDVAKGFSSGSLQGGSGLDTILPLRVHIALAVLGRCFRLASICRSLISN